MPVARRRRDSSNLRCRASLTELFTDRQRQWSGSFMRVAAGRAAGCWLLCCGDRLAPHRTALARRGAASGQSAPTWPARQARQVPAVRTGGRGARSPGTGPGHDCRRVAQPADGARPRVTRLNTAAVWPEWRSLVGLFASRMASLLRPGNGCVSTSKFCFVLIVAIVAPPLNSAAEASRDRPARCPCH